jgi:hypothetical protein
VEKGVWRGEERGVVNPMIEHRDGSDAALTMNRLVEMMSQVRPLLFLAFTFSPAGFAEMRAAINNTEAERMRKGGGVYRPIPDGPFNHCLGTPVYMVVGQVDKCLQWDDERAMREYINRMDRTEGEMMQELIHPSYEQGNVLCLNPSSP